MQIEQPLKNKFQDTLKQINELLTILNKKKDSSNVTVLTTLTKKIFFLVDQDNLQENLQKEDTSFAKVLVARLKNEPAIIPNPQNENEISLLILLALFMYKQKRWNDSRELLHQILFERPHLFYQKTYLTSLNEYLLYKYLNTIEFDHCFDQKKNDLYLILKDLQNSKKEELFSVLYIFMMRNLLLQNNYQEINALLKNCKFTENTQSVNYTKYLFYKGVFCGRVGEFKNSYKFVGEALRKAPTLQKNNKNQTGLKKYVLRVKKHYIILELLLNNLPNTQLFVKEPELDNYKQLVRMVSSGQKIHFENFIKKEEESFRKDGVWHLLMKMKSIVLRNALKRIAIAYTKISEQDMIQKMGITSKESFELKSFLAKSKNYLENFSLDNKNKIVNFAKTEEDYSNKSIREAFLQRIMHLNSLEKQVKKSLKFPEQKAKKTEKEEFNLDIDSLEDLDLNSSMFSED